MIQIKGMRMTKKNKRTRDNEEKLQIEAKNAKKAARGFELNGHIPTMTTMPSY